MALSSTFCTHPPLPSESILGLNDSFATAGFSMTHLGVQKSGHDSIQCIVHHHIQQGIDISNTPFGYMPGQFRMNKHLFILRANFIVPFGICSAFVQQFFGAEKSDPKEVFDKNLCPICCPNKF